MITLSYSSLNNLHNGHEWLNKQMGIPVPDYDFLREGKEAHAIFQKHISGVETSEFLKNIKVKFSIVEPDLPDGHPDYWKEKEKCKFSFSPQKGYEIIGYYDGRKKDFSETIEGKFSSTPWSLDKFKKSIQRKIYALSNDKIQTQYLITGYRDISKWESDPPKLRKLKSTKKDREEALAWILEGIKILEKGDFTGGLDENKKCTGCFWNMDRYQELANCNFL